MSASKQGYRPDQAADYLGSEQLLRECVAAGWLKPVVARKKMTIYAVGDLAKCWARIESSELPPRIQRK